VTAEELEFVLAAAALEALDAAGAACWVDRMRADDRVRRARRALPDHTFEEVRDLLAAAETVAGHLADSRARRAAR
jgi:hypothetical protein